MTGLLRKALSVFIVISVVASLGLPVFASTGSDKITGVVQSISLNDPRDYTSVQPGTVWDFPLTADMFTWSSGTVKGKDPVTSSQLNNITIESRNANSAVIKSISIGYNKAFAVTGNKSTAYVRVEFVKNYTNVTSREFETTVYLRYNKSRAVDSEMIISGVFENRQEEIDSSYEYYYMDGAVVSTTELIPSIELELGDGLIITTKLYPSRKYYGVAVDDVDYNDSRVRKYIDDIVGMYTLTTVNLKGSGRIVTIDAYDDCYIYNAEGKYLGEAPGPVEYSDKYYITTKKIDMGGGSTSSTSSSSTSSSSKATTTTTTKPATTTAASNTKEITTSSIKTETESAVKSAKSAGNKTAYVRVTNPKSISPDALAAMASVGKSSSITVRLNADTLTGSATTGRVSINAANASSLKNDISLGVYVDSGNTKATKDKFGKWFKNDIEVISLAQKGSFGMTVDIAAKINLKNLDTSKLYLYSYNKSNNTYSQIKNANVSTDKNSYIYFATSVGGEIIVSSGPLAK